MALTNVVADAVSKVGGIAVVARDLGVAPASVEEWMTKGTMKDAKYEHVIRFCALPKYYPSTSRRSILDGWVRGATARRFTHR
jgi:hypothetical protein